MVVGEFATSKSSPTVAGFFVCGTILCNFLYETPLAQMNELFTDSYKIILY